MEPLFFGVSDQPLFGWLHAPSGRAPRRTGVVLCAPFGQEYVLAHRALHGCARLLADAGFAALRFDWFGTGDSAGMLEEADLDRWQQDLAAAARTLTERAGCDDVALVGMRVGGTLAALASEALELAALVLWDPVVEGRLFLEELKAAHAREIRRLAPVPAAAADTLTEASGFPIGDRLRGELAALDLRRAPLAPGLPVLLLATEREEAAPAYVAEWRRRGHVVETLALPRPAVWEEDEQRVLVPHLALQAAMRWMEAQC